MATTTGVYYGITWGYAPTDTGWGTSFNTLAKVLDDLMMCGVINSTLAAPPASPANGDRYLVAASPSGAWSGQAGKIAVYYGSWAFYTPKRGFTVRCAVKGRLDYDGSAWVLMLTDAASDGIARLRKDGAWVAGVPEAPIDGNTYGRKNGAWVILP
jgi:hypothetical protein